MVAEDILVDAFSRVQKIVHNTVEGLSEEDLTFRPAKDANSIAWLVWHLSRVEDAQIAEVAGLEQVWSSDGWFDKFALPLDAGDTGYGHNSREVASVKASAEQLAGYYDAVHAQTTKFLKSLEEKDYARVVDENYDPPATLAVRLVSILNDITQHAGQSAYARGLLK